MPDSHVRVAKAGIGHPQAASPEQVASKANQANVALTKGGAKRRTGNRIRTKHEPFVPEVSFLKVVGIPDNVLVLQSQCKKNALFGS